MATSYTRQSSFSDGDTITAALFNNEFNQLLTAFSYASSGTTGHRHDGTAGEGGNIHTIGDQDFLNKILTTSNTWEFYVEVSSAAAKQMVLQDGALVPHADSDLDLGTSSKYFKDAYIDSITTTGNVAVGGNLTVTGTTTFNGGTLTLGDAADDNVVFGADVNSNIIPNTDNSYDLGSSTQEWKDLYVDGTAYLDAINFNGTAISATAAEINILDGVTATASELNIMDGVTATTAELNILDGVTATAAEINILDGVTATATELNIIDGVTATTTELNIMDGDTSATSTTLADADRVVVNDNGTMKQVALTDFETYFESAIDTIGGSLTVTGDLTISGDDLVMGTNTSGHLLIADGTNFNPTAVGDLSEISTVANDDVLLAVDTSGGGLKKISRSTLVSGLASSGAISNVVEDTTPQLGGDLDVNGNALTSTSNGNIALTPNGTGVVRLDGNVDIQSGEIVLKNAGSVSNVKFYCESSNAHYTQLQSAPHASYSGNVTLTLPASTDTLVGKATTDTLTNKTLTSPKINEDVVVSATATELNILDGVTATTAELNILDGVTATATELNILDGVTSTTAELNILDGVTSTAAELNILDGVTSTAAELNILDGVTSSTAELNILDAVSRGSLIYGNSSGATALLTKGSASTVLTSDGTDIAWAAPAASGVTYVTKTANYTTQDLEGVLANTSGGAFTVTLPASPSAGAQVIVADSGDAFGTNNLTVARNGETIDGTAADFVLDITGVSVQFVYNGSTWRVYAQVGGKGGNAVTTTGTQTLTNKTLTSPKINEDVAVSATATEINILDGVTSTTAELNILDGVTSTAAELNILDGVTATATELNLLDGVTSTTAELNILDGVTANATEINKLDALSRGSLIYGNASGATAILTKGSADQVLTSDGTDIAWADAGGGGGFTSMQVFTSSGTWTKPSGITKVLVTVVGGGGGGGGAGAGYTGSGGGGGGGAAIKLIDVSSISSETVTIGAGGSGTSRASGSNGGNSSFGSHATGNGGTGGTGGDVNNPDGGAGGTGSGGLPNIDGGGGGAGSGGSTSDYIGGTGGYSIFAGGGRSGSGTASGSSAGGYGAGGGGSGSHPSSNRSGGSGSGGIVIVKEYA